MGAPRVDKLYRCLQAYQALATSCSYHYVVARRKIKYSLNLQFEMNNFVHLIGIRHLKDLPILRSSDGNLIAAISNNRLKIETLQTSQFFLKPPLDIEARIKCVSRLDEFLQSDHLVIDYLNYPELNSRVEADWLFRSEIDNETWYLFVKSKERKTTKDSRKSGNYVCSSMFMKRHIEYGASQKPMTILLKERHNLNSKTKQTLFCHPNYTVPS